MLNLSDSACYPVCETCRAAGTCNQETPGSVSAPERRQVTSLDVAPNRRPMVRLTCGCLADIIPLVKLFDIHSIHCDRHGWVKEYTEPKPKKKKGQGRQDESLFDEPPY